MTWRIEIGDAREVLAGMAPESVNCCVTSPPFWGLRDYGVVGQIGLEASPDEWAAKLVEVFREVRRVLRPDGTLWLEVGDSYAATTNRSNFTPHRMDLATVKPKDLVGQPWLLAFALRADGWWLRSEVIWSRPNPMPESVTDRPTKSHSTVFLLTKNARYFYDAKAVRETVPERLVKMPDGWATHEGGHGSFHRDGREKGVANNVVVSGRNARSVWTIPTEPFSGAHFATMASELARRCILAGTSAKGCCAACGAPWVRVVEKTAMIVREGPGRAGARGAGPGSSSRTACTGTMLQPPSSLTIGWRPTCHCEAAVTPATVLDPFAGAGTTMLAAEQLGRDSIGIELSPEYAEMAETRLRRYRSRRALGKAEPKESSERQLEMGW